MPISIIEFSVENFKIFQKKATLSFFARKSDHTYSINGENLLKTSLIYGPNASGKSTILDAISLLKTIIVKSANSTEDTIFPYYPFLLSNKEKKPVFFEIVFSLNKKILKYNFSISENSVITENLLEVLKSGEEKVYLERKKQDIKLFYDFEDSQDIVDVKTKENVLFLSAAFQWNNKLAIDIVENFKEINIISGINSSKYSNYTMNLFETSNERKNKILKFLKKADFCIEDGFIEKIEIPEGIKKKMMLNMDNVPGKASTISFSHIKFDSKGNKLGTVKFNYANESKGTQKFFDVLGPIIDTLEHGRILFIDEFDNSLHPKLTKFIIDLFEKNNPNNAQLVVTTHDTSLLSYKELSKEQIWFTEKKKLGDANLFSLAEFDIRNDIEFSKKYLEGRFGALPFINYEE